MASTGDETSFRLSPGAAPVILQVGQEREPVVVIDDASGQAARLRAFAAERSRFEPADRVGSAYPGLLGPAPIAYIDALVRLSLPLIAAHFTGQSVTPARARGNFSLVTTSGTDLDEAQRRPHVDAADRMQFAVVHFLSDTNDDGTGFFRHRATGFETIDPDRLAEYHAAQDNERGQPSSHYQTGSDACYEMTAAVPAVCDRLILYRAALLHSGLITDVPTNPADPRHGRLTGNLFLQCRRAM